MKIKKKLLGLLLLITFCFTMVMPVAPASAASSTVERELQAKALYEMGLFQGYDSTGTNFGLSDRVTREQAVVFLIRLLGEEKAALAWTGAQPFDDVPSSNWVFPYIGYAKEKGYTVGLSKQEFGLNRYATMQEMTMFTLRGLGYSDAAGVKDFDYNSSLTLAKSKGILSSAEAVVPFTRSEAVDIIFNALGANIKGQEYDLLSKLMNQGVVSQAQYDKAMVVVSGGTNTAKVAVSGVSLNATTATLAVGATKQLTATIKPANATNKAVTWSSSNSSVATVSSTGLVKAVKDGSATITAKTTDGSKTATCKVTVSADKLTKADFKMVNSTGKSITEYYIADDGMNEYDEDFLATNNYKSWSNGKHITAEFEFYKDTTFDFYVRFSDGTEMEATGLSFAKATTAGGTITLTTKEIKLVNSTGAPLSTAAFSTKGSTSLDADSKKVTDRYNKAVTRYNKLVDQCTALGLNKDAEFVKVMNDITTEIDKMGKVIGEGTGKLTAAQIAEYNKVLDILDGFMNTMDASLNKAGTNASAADVKKVSDRYDASVKRYNAQVDQINALGLSKDPQFTKSLNEITDAIDAMGKIINKGKLTTDQVTQFGKDLDALDTLMGVLDTQIKSAQNQPAVVSMPLTIVNNTGVELHAIYLSPSDKTDWGTDLLATTMPTATKGIVTFQTLQNVSQWDMMIVDGEGTEIEFKGLDFTGCTSDGATITLTFNATTGEGTASLVAK